MKIRKRIAILFCLLLVFGLAGCKKKATPTGLVEDKTDELTTEDTTYFEDLFSSKGILDKMPNYTLQFLVLTNEQYQRLLYVVQFEDSGYKDTLYFTLNKDLREIRIEYSGLDNPPVEVIDNYALISKQLFGLSDSESNALLTCSIEVDGTGPDRDKCGGIDTEYNFGKFNQKQYSFIIVVSKSVVQTEPIYGTEKASE